MAYKCDNCNKGKEHGHMVSHAKNRLARLFLPNLQKLRVFKNGIVVRVKFCTSCIKRLRKDGFIGKFAVIKLQASGVAKLPYKSIKKTIEQKTKIKLDKEVKIQEKARETLDISAIVGKKVD